ncbi:MAG: carbohydrate kinase family protein [Cyclobacteriaceae bacterium]
MKSLVFGEVLWDIIEGVPHLGGAPLNFAAHVQQCGHTAGIISAVGRDDFGNQALSEIENLGLDTSMIQVSDFRTGFVPVTLTNGQPDYEITKEVAYDYIRREQLDSKRISDFDTFYFGSIVQRSGVSNEALYHILDSHDFRQIFYDVNLRRDAYSKEVIERSLKYCTVLKLNDDEVDIIGPMLFGKSLSIPDFGEEVGRKYSQIETVITTAGGDGCYVFSDGKISQVPAEKITVLDTVGAGDSFSASFMCVYSSTGDPVKAASIGNKVGGYVASNSGPIPKYSNELMDLFKQ